VIRAAALAAAALVTGWLVAVALAGLLFLLPAAAQEVSACADRAGIVEGLALRYGEVPVAVAMTSAAQLVEIFASPETGTWTIVVTSPGGPSCLAAAGQSFELIPPPLPGIPG
jgi:hypothetical protein